MSTQVTYETDIISLIRVLIMSKALKFCFYVIYCNLKVKDIRRKINSKKMFICETSIIAILPCRKSGSVGPVQ